MKSSSIPTILILLGIVFWATEGQRVSGCARYDLLEDESVRCAECLPIYGLTEKFTCELCSQGFALTDGTCKTQSQSSQPNENKSQTSGGQTTESSAANNNSQDNSSKNQEAATSSPTTTQGNQNSINFGSFASDSSSFDSFSGDGTESKNSFPQEEFSNFGSNTENNELSSENAVSNLKQVQKKPQNLKQTQSSSTQKTKDPLQHCFVFSGMRNVCLKCEDQYILKDEGFCYSQEQLKDLEEQLQKQNLTKQQQSPSSQVQKGSSTSIKTSESQKILSSSQQSQSPQKNETNSPASEIKISTNKSEQANTFSSFEVNNDDSFSAFGNTPTPKQKQPSLQNDFFNVDGSFSSFGDIPDFSGSHFDNVPQSQVQKVLTHKYPQFPFCYDYEDGKCWACVSGYILNLIVNKCVKAEVSKTPTILKTLDDEIKSSNSNPISTTPDQFCNMFSETTNQCTQCFRGYYFDSSKAICVLVDPLCRTFEYIDGQCVSCYKSYHLDSGKCIHD